MPRKRGYHHGELREALIAATDAILRENGIEGFTLRDAARRADVSPGAPAHHFGNASGLLTEVAILGYRELGRYLAAVPDSGTPTERMRAIAAAYVAFALDHPGRFRLMFRKDLINRSDPQYETTSRQALVPLAEAAAQVSGTTLEALLKVQDLAPVFAAWSTAHGIAHLALEEKMQVALQGNYDQDFRSRLLPEILKAQWP
ncbi:TetR/AcrR family transcriptional regulator [Mesorhizobium sp. M4A.F.Ca.ET.020.02.1.1]|uniref:TetR/AcrR family transcriptional regulator n=1 Tax=unclassified Mesorhizobium TaxID=325217 RepID=UPI000FD611AC|nr:MULTISPECIES: TetR/AcrR family transcriptional regulator [unclassified Mesorhizobium]RVD38515.1 TetR/AcrR family transcriptional regulator [Mesorhizobium sp. M4A.F.Ca.ET.020.02.1.1]RWC17085.1 MAG: TetR/AcrR family transcriptional regulator [Mesorhizobium sp.]